MKKVNTDALEKMAKQKNIDKDKIEKIADNYKDKSENELMDELIKIGKNLEGREEVVSKFKAFLDDNQRKKLDTIMNKISDAEIQSKIENKKSKTKKATTSNPTQPEEKNTSSKNTQKNNQNSPSSKKVKRVKRVKKTHTK